MFSFFVVIFNSCSTEQGLRLTYILNNKSNHKVTIKLYAHGVNTENKDLLINETFSKINIDHDMLDQFTTYDSVYVIFDDTISALHTKYYSGDTLYYQPNTNRSISNPKNFSIIENKETKKSIVRTEEYSITIQDYLEAL